MKGLKGLAFVMVLFGLTVCAPHANAENKSQIERFQVESTVKPNSSTRGNENTNSNLERGFNLIQSEDYRGAIQAFNQVIQTESNNQYAYFGRGIANFQLENYQQAKVDLDKSINLDSSIAYAYLVRGLTHHVLGSKTDAISDLQTAANLFEKEGEKEMAQKSLNMIEKIRNA
ncbi:MAG: tetratricopeptide repeat protein [Scytonema sp. PMC 1069.18]|nr:tetratricopeptide repeat protein [Scytonema sp. PMC 1069.18]MEC4879816.1 tetratricopeptide repeat protein [Scytonema sp. PMC 1070.18]